MIMSRMLKLRSRNVVTIAEQGSDARKGSSSFERYPESDPLSGTEKYQSFIQKFVNSNRKQGERDARSVNIFAREKHRKKWKRRKKTDEAPNVQTGDKSTTRLHVFACIRSPYRLKQFEYVKNGMHEDLFREFKEDEPVRIGSGVKWRFRGKYDDT